MKLAFVGSAPSSRHLAPFNDPEWQIWACSPDNAGHLPKVDLWFELHADLGWPENQGWAVSYLEWINKQDFPVFAQDQAFISRAKVFPHTELMRLYGHHFFTSTFAWMMAYAMEQGATEIALYGMDMATVDEYLKQRAGFHHFALLAKSKGIKIKAPHECDVLQPPPLYGYHEGTPLGRKLAVRKQEIETRIAEQKEIIDRATYVKTHLSGALDNILYTQWIWCGHSDHADDVRHLESGERTSVRKPNGSAKPISACNPQTQETISNG